MITFRLLVENFESPERGSYVSYGFEAQQEKEILSFHDVTIHRELIVRFIDLFSKYHVAFEHIGDVFEDLYGSGYICRFYPELCKIYVSSLWNKLA
jgi:hypothetical protein